MYKIFTFNKNNEVLLAMLSDLPFDSFQEFDDTLEGYVLINDLNDEMIASVDEVSAMLDVTYTIRDIEEKNWNEEWESNFSPVEVESFCRIRADFHERSDDFDFEMTIHPKMAFGTGHHQTTHMMIRAMKDIDFVGKTVLDYGCGTGILAILAEKLGAINCDAVDIELPSYENTSENATINNCDHIQSIHGTLDDVPNQAYDVILANINRNILLDSVDDIVSRISTNGILLLSGLLAQDEEIIMTAYEPNFKLIDKFQRDNWICIKMVRR
jgi:ribosomal protein L11 methyltransferase